MGKNPNSQTITKKAKNQSNHLILRPLDIPTEPNKRIALKWIYFRVEPRCQLNRKLHLPKPQRPLIHLFIHRLDKHFLVCHELFASELPILEAYIQLVTHFFSGIEIQKLNHIVIVNG